MAVSTITTTSPIDFDIDLQNLATSATFIAGRESDEINNTSTNYVDAIVSGRISVGTTPTANTTIAVYVWGANVAASATAVDVLVGVDGAASLTNAGVLSGLRLGHAISITATTSDIDYPVPAFSVAALFGGSMPRYWGLYVTHNTGANLRNTSVNDNPLSYVGVTYTTA